ncbi:MAG: FtsH protease activity modulator HflK [Gammaproteobacteria bacterium]|jgi:membrane protease subunit HflK|nr:FtsH protease activity modulator HflK [Gammaproteobacteria bacterium]
MSWSDENGKDQGPWGRSRGGRNGSNGGHGGGSGGGSPPELEEMIRRGQDKFKSLSPKFRGTRGFLLLLLVAIGIWLATGFYRVQPDEQGIVLRFGEWTKTTQPGLNYHLPAPFETAFTPKVTRVNRAEIGYRTIADSRGSAFPRSVANESLMLTGDENIIDVKFTVFWKIDDAGKYLFNIRSPDRTVKDIAESAMREVIGKTNLQSALAEGRQPLAQATHELTQQILNEYDSGILVTQVEPQSIDPPDAVIASFRDVQAARADQERLKEEAERHRNTVVPEAQGRASAILEEARTYRAEVVNQAIGQARRFVAVYNEYRQAKDVTKRRIYLETMETLLSGMNKVVIGNGAGGQGVVPYLPLPELQKNNKQQSLQQGNR